MKRFISLALLTALVAAAGITGSVDAKSYGQKLKFVKGPADGTTDSTFISLEGGLPSDATGTVSDPDTTQWFKVPDLQCNFVDQTPALAFITVKTTAPTLVVGDSLGVTVQYSVGPESSKLPIVTLAPAKKPNINGAFTFPIVTCQDLAVEGTHNAIWMRLIIQDGDASRTAPWENVQCWVAFQQR